MNYSLFTIKTCFSPNLYPHPTNHNSHSIFHNNSKPCHLYRYKRVCHWNSQRCCLLHYCHPHAVTPQRQTREKLRMENGEFIHNQRIFHSPFSVFHYLHFCIHRFAVFNSSAGKPGTPMIPSRYSTAFGQFPKVQ